MRLLLTSITEKEKASTPPANNPGLTRGKVIRLKVVIVFAPREYDASSTDSLNCWNEE